MSVRVVEIEVCSKELSLHQASVGDVSCVVWDAAIVLSKYLQLLTDSNGDSVFIGKKVLELGSGVGCVGLTAATLGAEVVLTDLPEALSLLKLNVDKNKSVSASRGGFAIAEPLIWGDVESDVIKNTEFDYVLLADCVYYEESIDPLINTLKSINNFTTSKPKILITQELRDTEKQQLMWSAFYKRLIESFHVTKIKKEAQHKEYNSDDILVLSCTSKN